MAYVISKDDHLARSYKTQTIVFWWSLGIGAALLGAWMFLLFFVSRPNIWVVVLLPAAAIGALSFSKNRYHRLSALAAGIRGEKQALEVLKKLDNEHWIVTDKVISHRGRSSELDFVVIGPTGVCVIECKHLAGRVVADPEAQYWLQIKASYTGVERKKSIYSPVKQVNTHLYRLKKFLKEKGVSVHLDCAVFFPDPETQLDIGKKDWETPIFWGEKGQDLLLKFLSKNRCPLTPAQVLEIAELLHAEN